MKTLLRQGPRKRTVYVPDNGKPDLIAHDIFEADVYEIKSLAKREPKVVVDIGAHCGFFAMRLAEECPSLRKLVCIEPDLKFMECCRQNTKDLRCEVVYVRCAVRHDGRSELYINPETGMAMTYDPSANFCDEIKNYPHYTVPTRRFDSICDEFGVAVIDILKIDCEGSEFDILPNIPPRIRDRIKCIVGEYHHPAGWPVLKAHLDIYYKHLKSKCLGDPSNSVEEFIAFQ